MEEDGYMMVVGYFNNNYGIWYDDGEVKDISERLFYMSNNFVKYDVVYERCVKGPNVILSYVKAFNDTKS